MSRLAQPMNSSFSASLYAFICSLKSLTKKFELFWEPLALRLWLVYVLGPLSSALSSGFWSSFVAVALARQKEEDKRCPCTWLSSLTIDTRKWSAQLRENDRVAKSYSLWILRRSKKGKVPEKKSTVSLSTRKNSRKYKSDSDQIAKGYWKPKFFCYCMQGNTDMTWIHCWTV